MRALLCTLALLASTAAIAGEREDLLVSNAAIVLKEMRTDPATAIPEALLTRAQGIVIVPNAIQLGFIIGGRLGDGVLLMKNDAGAWAPPIFVRLGGGSVGFQAGGQASDLVLVFTTRRGLNSITDGKMTVGVDASVAAGPVGRQGSVGTDLRFEAEVYSYSRTRGLFAGVALDGTGIFINGKANAAFYNRNDVTPRLLLSNDAPPMPAVANELIAAVGTVTRPYVLTPAPGTAPAPAAAAPAPTAAPAPAPGGSAETFPLEDPAPGTEPR